jgi:hypothetical protein
VAAAKSLGAWDDGLQIDMVVVRQAERERERIREEQQAGKDRERQDRVNAREWLHCCERLYRESSARLTELRHQGEEAEIHWSILALLTDEIRDAEALYLQKAGLL